MATEAEYVGKLLGKGRMANPEKLGNVVGPRALLALDSRQKEPYFIAIAFSDKEGLAKVFYNKPNPVRRQAHAWQKLLAAATQLPEGHCRPVLEIPECTLSELTAVMQNLAGKASSHYHHLKSSLDTRITGEPTIYDPFDL